MSALAVGVSLIGFAGVLFTISIFVQMLLSFPAMLSSNARTYVHQQRKVYHISPPMPDEEFEEVDDSAVVDAWLDDVVDEDISEVEVPETPTERKISPTMRRLQPITRGRTLRRQIRRPLSRRVDDYGDDYDSELTDTASIRKDRSTQPHNDFVLRWKRSMEWSRR